jgi:xanthine dehydrogenase accessory factor
VGCHPAAGGQAVDTAIIALLAEHAAEGRRCALATVVRTESPTSAHPGDKALIGADGRLVGWIGGSCSEPLVRREALAAMADGLPRLVRIRPGAEAGESRSRGEVSVATTCPSGGALDIFIDPQLPPPLLVSVGQSPAAATLLRLGRAMGLRTCSVRRGPGTGAPGGAAVGSEGSTGTADADRSLAFADLGQLREQHDVWVVVATMGHDDEDAVEAALTLPHADISLVASARRAAAVLDSLRQRGVGEGQLARVRSPAGGRRGGTQAEIALHALAEVVGLRRDRLRGAVPLDSGDDSDGASRLGVDAPAGEAEAFAVDPVCGMTVEIATATRTVQHEGRIYYLCCAGCATSFAAEPARFLHTAPG